MAPSSGAGRLHLKREVKVRVFQATPEEMAPHPGEFQLLPELPDHLNGIKLLAGEDVNVEEAFFHKGVDGDMAFGDEHESGKPPVFRLGAYIPENEGRGHLFHAYLGRKPVQEAVDEPLILEELGVRPIPVHYQVH
jgi:hypothetical protein